MTPLKLPSITDGQILKFTEVLAARLRNSGLPRDLVQKVLGKKNTLAGNFEDELRRLVVMEEKASMTLVRTVDVEGGRDPEAVEKALKAAGFQTPYAIGSPNPFHREMVKGMPRTEAGTKEVHFFNLGCNPLYPRDPRLISVGSHSNTLGISIAAEYQRRSLTPVDPYTLATINEQDPSFAREYPNGTHWLGEDTRTYHMAFSAQQNTGKMNPGLYADIYHLISQHVFYVWLAGVHK